MANLKNYSHRYVCYPESIHENFFQVLCEFGIPYKYILHDKDLDKNGNLKKPHYHVLFGRKLTKKEKDIVIKFGGVKVVSDVNYPDEAEKYLVHEDNDDKHKYSNDDVITSDTWCQEDWEQILSDYSNKKSKPSADDQCLSVFSDIIEYEITSYSSLINMYISHQDKEKLAYAVNKAYAIKTYISENRYIFAMSEGVE